MDVNSKLYVTLGPDGAVQFREVQLEPLVRRRAATPVASPSPANEPAQPSLWRRALDAVRQRDGGDPPVWA